MNAPDEHHALPELQVRARQVLPAGGFGNFDPEVIIARGKGARVWDVDGREYVDYLIGSGPMLVGHGHPEVIEAIEEQLGRGTTFFANNPQGVELAETISEAVACARQVRFLSSGGEADMYAMRLARAYTGRELVMKFEGGYHGMEGEALMSLTPSGKTEFPLAEPDSAGIPEGVRNSVLIAPFNNAEYARDLIAAHAGDIACVIVEPLQRIIPPKPGFLEALREETERHGIVLIFDEVVTGFRLAYGGAQERYGVVPDLCTLGKIIGGGLPLAAVAGRRDIMAHFDADAVGKAGFTFQVGTLSGNPLAAAAGLKTLEILRRPGSYERIIRNGEILMDAVRTHLSAAGIAHQVVGDPVLFDVIFSDREVVDYRDAIRNNEAQADLFNRVLREHGILKAPQKVYVSMALTEADLDQSVEAIAAASRLEVPSGR